MSLFLYLFVYVAMFIRSVFLFAGLCLIFLFCLCDSFRACLFCTCFTVAMFVSLCIFPVLST